MPPPESNLALTEKEKSTIRQWIAEGAKYQPHWSFIPLPASVPVPTVKNKKWPRNEIDQFILARLEKEKLKPSGEAERARWLRRVTFDLTGLPPKLEEIDAFLKDRSATAYEKVVDRLLASPRYGERMAVPWLDAARYADSYGYQSDQLSPTWPFRDWVVQAFNRNLPYDKFLTEQLAGDLLPLPKREDRLATAFNRLHRQTGEGGSIEEEWRNEYVSDRVHTFSTAMMGLTFECARCHDHKYDPITQRDYYNLSAFFNSIDEYGLYNDAAHVPTPSLLLPNGAQDAAMTASAGELKAKRLALDKSRIEADGSFDAWLKSTNLSGAISTVGVRPSSGAAEPGKEAGRGVLPGGEQSDIAAPEDGRTPSRAGLVAHFSFDQFNATNQVTSDEGVPAQYSSALSANVLVPGRSGQAIKLERG